MRFPCKSSGLLSINFERHRETRPMRRIGRKRSHTVWSWWKEEAGEVREDGRRCRRGKARTRGVRHRGEEMEGSIRGGRANQVKQKDGGERKDGRRDGGRQQGCRATGARRRREREERRGEAESERTNGSF